MLGEKVRAARISQGLTQAETARRVGKTPAWLCDVEKGHIEPSLAAARDLTRLLKLSPTCFLGDLWRDETPLC